MAPNEFEDRARARKVGDLVSAWRARHGEAVPTAADLGLLADLIGVRAPSPATYAAAVESIERLNRWTARNSDPFAGL